MKKHLFTLICLLSALFPVTCGAGAAELNRLTISLDLIETRDAKWIRQDIMDAIPVLARRKNADKFRYLGGGNFSLPPYTEEIFLVRNPESELEVRLSWRPLSQDGTLVSLHYILHLSYPGQPDYLHAEKTMTLSAGKTSLISDSDSPQGAQDTRPIWALVKVKPYTTSFAYPLQGSIGAKLQVKGGYPYIIDILPLSPAFKAGLSPGDELQEIDGFSTLQMTLEQVSRLIRGDPGTEIKIKVRKAHERTIEEKTLVREMLATQ